MPTTTFDSKKVPESFNNKTGVLTFGDATPTTDAPMLIKNSTAITAITGTRSITSTATLTSGSGVPMQGVYTNGSVPTSEGSNFYYIVGTDNNLHKVVAGGSGVTIAPFRAYFHLSDASFVKGNLLYMNFEDEDAIENVMDDGQWTMDNAVIYNLNGQRLSKMQKGINIINGKKVLVK